jgi:hypothetical protein
MDNTITIESPEDSPVGTILHEFHWYMADEMRSGRIVCCRKIIELPFRVVTGMKIVAGGMSDGGLVVRDVKLDIDDPHVIVNIGRKHDPTEEVMISWVRSLLDHGWEIYFEDNHAGVVPIASVL